MEIKKLFIFNVLTLFLASSCPIFAQDDAPPPLNPFDSTWPTPPPAPPAEGAPGGAATPPAGGDNPFGGAPGGDPFDPFGDSGGDEFGGGGASPAPRGSSKREGKSSFMLVDPKKGPTCNTWGNVMLGEKSFDDMGNCQFELERMVDQGRAMIEENQDRFERYKLKKVIRGQMKREDTTKYRFDFSRLQKQLDDANKQGCSCISTPPMAKK